ncbi:hypothetical protein HK102_005517, partial [Quaeritorhiza haematococci]
MVTIPGMPVALAMNWRQDNEGPHSIEEIAWTFSQIRTFFPNAKRVVAGSFEDFADAMEEFLEKRDESPSTHSASSSSSSSSSLSSSVDASINGFRVKQNGEIENEKVGNRGKDLLPEVEAEIGDTWIYGVPSDPYRMASFRALQRLRT